MHIENRGTFKPGIQQWYKRYCEYFFYRLLLKLLKILIGILKHPLRFSENRSLRPVEYA